MAWSVSMACRKLFVVGLCLALRLYCTEGKPRSKKPEPDFCTRGFKVSSKYFTCWTDATYEHQFFMLDPDVEVYTPEVLEQYALHMCNVVKPTALDCFAQEISACSNAENLYKMADTSGGTCLQNQLNPAFKSHVIGQLSPVALNSPCFDIADTARQHCYDVATAIPPQASSVDIDNFSKIANKIFSHIWSCHIKMYRGKCPNWQMPMLFALQQTAMPSLFGMQLNLHQISMLELGDLELTPEQDAELAVNDEEDDAPPGNTLLLLRVIADRTEAGEGDVVVEMKPGEDGDGFQLSSGNDEAVSFYKSIFNSKGGINMRLVREKAKEMKQKLKAARKGRKEIAEFLGNMKYKNAEKKKQKP